MSLLDGVRSASSRCPKCNGTTDGTQCRHCGPLPVRRGTRGMPQAAPDPQPTSICGMCGHFGNCDENDFGTCAVDASGKGYQVHRMYQSNCTKLKRFKQTTINERLTK
jgi:hypothetical protein